MPRHLIPRECTATPPSSPPCSHFSTSAIRSAQCSSYAARIPLVAAASEWASSITCVQVLGPTVLAAAISTNRFYSQLYHLPETPTNAMIGVTQVVLLSDRRELSSEYAELSFDIPHSISVKVASWSTPICKTAGQLYSKRLSILYHATLGKRWVVTNTTPLLRGMQAAAFTCAD